MPTEDQLSVQRLRKLAHIVVVMMENRSFDHMLGYLPLEGMIDVNGLTGRESNLDADGREIFVHAFDAEANKVQPKGEALQKSLDPDHSPKGVQIQLGDGYGAAGSGPNKGFVESFIKSRNPDDKVPEDLWMVPMGYYTSKDVPVYDHLARQYCVCDSWFSSIPGDTWPNRVFALTGEHGENVARDSELLKRLEHLPFVDKLRSMPLYDKPAFTRHLRDEQWRWYSHDPGTLRLADSKYRDLHNPMRDNFAFYDKRKVDWLTQLLEKPIENGGAFLDDAGKGELPQVSWIDPNFVDVSVLETASNDDHPPSDIRAGQAFVYEIYDALRHSPGWEDTLLVITYDEHGGFYDHVPPPALPTPDGSDFSTYGVRVPALIIGPRVRREVLHGPRTADGSADHTKPQFDHASLIKTILLAAADNPDVALPKMSQRVQDAPHLGSMLLDEPRTDIDDPRNTENLMDAWRLEARRRRTAKVPVRTGGEHVAAAADGAGHPLILTDLQVEVAKFSRGLKELRLNP